MKILVGNISTTGHHAKEVSPDYILEEKETRIKIKGMDGLGNICIHDRCGSPSTKAPTGKPCISLLSLHPFSRHPLPPHLLTWLGFDFSRKHPTSSEQWPNRMPCHFLQTWLAD
jgi:hypothetical protein